MSYLSKSNLVIKNIISSYYKIFILLFSLIVKLTSNIILKLICFTHVNLTRTRAIPHRRTYIINYFINKRCSMIITASSEVLSCVFNIKFIDG